MHTISQIAKKFAISRSTLLYYDSIGLLSPSGRSDANYRLYSDDDIRKMEKITLYRQAGLSLDSINAILSGSNSQLHDALDNRLFAINQEINALREQQQTILRIMKQEHTIPNSNFIDKKTWVSLLAKAGLDESGMSKWHIEFEKTSPQGHQRFLESLSIEQSEINSIRQWSQAGIKTNLTKT